jgi:hypothetical protein
MGGEVTLADVRLDLDDPADATAARGGFTDEVRADERARGVERRPGEDLPRERSPERQRRASSGAAALA